MSWCWLLLFVAIAWWTPAVDGAECSAITENSDVQVHLPASEYILQNCHWSKVNLVLIANGPFTVILRNIVMDAGALTIKNVSDTTSTASTVSVEGSTIVGADCLRVYGAAQVLSRVHVVVTSSTFLATQSAVTLSAARVEHSSITVRNSQIEVQCSSAACEAVSADATVVVNVSISSFSSRISTVATGGSSTSMGVAPYSSSSYIGTSLNLSNLVLFASASNVTATGTTSAIAVGFAVSRDASAAIVNAANVILYGSACRVTANAAISAAALGFASYVFRFPSVLIATNFTVYASACTVAAIGVTSVAAMGFASYGYGAVSLITATNIYLYALQSVVSVAGGYAVSAMGLVSYSTATSAITATNVTVCAIGCDASFAPTGVQQVLYSVSLFGLASCGYSTGATMTTTETTLYSSGCTAKTAGTTIVSLAVLGITSYTYTSSSLSTVTATDITIYASGCMTVVTATAASCVAAVGIISCGSSSSLTFSGVLMGCCDTRVALPNADNIAAVASAVSTFPPINRNARWVLLRSRIEVPKGLCMTILPSVVLPSVAVNVELLCLKAGWSEQRPFCWSNVTFNGKGLDPSSTPTTYTNSPCPYSKATCDEVVSPPRAPMQPPSPPDEHTFTLTQSRTLSSRISSASSTRALPRLRKTTSARPYSLSLSQQGTTLSDTSMSATEETPSAVRTATPTIRVPTEAPMLGTQKSAALATTSCALVAATATGGGVELQGAIVLGMMDCSNEYVRKVSDGSSRLVTLLYDQSAPVRVLGNLLASVAAVVLHFAAVVVVRLRDGSSTLGEAAAKCRFPGLSHRIFLLCFQGLMLESLRGVVQHSGDSPTLVVSCVGLCTCVVVPVLVVVQSAHASREVAYSPYLAALNKFPRWARGLLLPRGWWLCREDAARRWGALFFFTAGPSRVAFCLAPYIRPVAASVAAVVVDVPCTGRMVFLGCVHALLAVAVLMVRPHRIGWAGCCSVAMDALLVCMIAMTLMPGSESTSRGISWLMSGMGVVSVVATIGHAAVIVAGASLGAA